jgi:hypothetical protein
MGVPFAFALTKARSVLPAAKIKIYCFWVAEPGDPKVCLFARIKSAAVGHPRNVAVQLTQRKLAVFFPHQRRPRRKAAISGNLAGAYPTIAHDRQNEPFVKATI